MEEMSMITKTTHSVLMPVSVASWYSGSDGTTVGMAETELVASGTLARALMGSTIILSVFLLLFF
jgi:hypothetical protein